MGSGGSSRNECVWSESSIGGSYQRYPRGIAVVRGRGGLPSEK